ncbi:hypothetical protein UFOVP635_19 [uncultured Caudovirales phage]|uniref:SbsA Ig-like domain-containing protein n=1 Tax=uncultured Caudovirales phage TaxID=2100421 RepID=A0A6J5N242_9CAUD|nr:hypothetical protein UFOVP635_19 [uncultured Caudovirales phage]
MNTLQQLNVYSTATVSYTDQGLGSGQVLANRYQINGLLDTAKPVLENMEKITDSAGSWMTYDIHTGKWGIVINQTGTSIASFDSSNIIGNITVNGTGLQDLYNSVNAQFPHRELKDSGDFIKTEIPVGDFNPNEQKNTLDLTYDIINEPVQAQLLSLIELKQSRVDKVITLSTDYTYINLKAGDIIDVTDSLFDFDQELFRIVTISEIVEQDSGLMVSITAIQYDPDVYSTADLYRYTRTDDTGIIGIGSIGVPGTPQVTKFEQDVRPHALIETTAPTGIVEGIEYWLSTDVSQTQDNLRSYSLIGTRKPVGGGNFTSGVTVTLDYTQSVGTNFLIKTRGFNSTTVGPYSNPSGFVYFEPQQVTEAVGPETSLLDTVTGLALTLGANYLLKKVFDLATSSGTTTTASIFDSIFGIFKEETGVDLPTVASSGGLQPPVLPYITIRDEGSSLTTQAAQINFVGDGVRATTNGNNVTVTIGSQTVPGDGTTVVIDPGCGLKEGDTPIWKGDKWVGSSAPAESAASCSLNFISPIVKYPPDRTTYQDPTTGVTSDQAPITGSYYLRFGGRTFYGPLSKGTGNAKLYKSDGTLVQTLTQDQLTIDKNLVGFPFNARQLGTDYYILIDEGIVIYCDSISVEYNKATQWNFNTPLYETTPYSLSGDNPNTPDAPLITTTGVSFLMFQNVAGTYVKPNTDPCLSGLENYVVGSGRSAVTFDVIKQSGVSSIIVSPTVTTTGYKKDDIIRIPRRSLGGDSGYLYMRVTDVCQGDIRGIGIYSGSLPEASIGPCSQLMLNLSIDALPGTGNIVLTNSSGTQTGVFSAAAGVVYNSKIIDGETYYFSGTKLKLGAMTGKVQLGDVHNITIPAGAITYDPSKAENVDCYFPTAGVPSSTQTAAVSIVPAITLTNFIVSSSPVSLTNDITKANPQTNIILEFNTPIVLGDAGTFSIYEASGTLHQVIDVTTSFESNKTNELIWTSGSQLYLNPTKDLKIKTTYYVRATNGSLKSNCVTWSGISNNTTVRFSTDPGPTATITNSSTGVISLTYDRPIEVSTGSIRITGTSGEVYALPGNWPGIIYN